MSFARVKVKYLGVINEGRQQSVLSNENRDGGKRLPLPKSSQQLGHTGRILSGNERCRYSQSFPEGGRGSVVPRKSGLLKTMISNIIVVSIGP